MSERKVKSMTYCKLHNIPSFNMSDGTVVHTCSECYPEVLEGREHHFRIQNYGAHDNAAGGYCDNDTLDWLKMCATISVQCPPKAEDDFYSDHLELTGYECDGKYVYASKDENKYWYSAKVEFEWDDSLIFNSSFKICESGNRKCVHSVPLVGYLLANGLKVGRNDE